MELHLDRLTCIRAGRLIFRDLEFRLEGGQVAALRGPNGVGKSTLLRQLAGFLPVVDGDARLGEVSLRADRAGFQEQIAYAGHLDAVKPALTVGENLGVWCAINGSPDSLIAPALERFGLARIAGRPAAQCSAGQKRRLGLARLMVVKRPLWLMDEPTVSLDTQAVETVAGLVREHVAEGGLALIATHAELGLGEIPVLRMEPPEPAGASHHDPFLAEGW